MQPSIHFTKMQAAANDFVLLDRANFSSVDMSTLARQLCDRALGIGSDGLILFECADNQPVKMDFFNPDGSPDVCGNGMRCLAGLLVAQNQRRANDPFSLSTGGTLYDVAACNVSMRAQVLLPIPSFDPKIVPTTSLQPIFNSSLKVAGRDVKISAINTGSTHCVIIVDNLESSAFEQLGQALECHQLFPQRTSVDLVEVINRDNVKARVWERAIGETPACGTGACAIALVCERLGLTGSNLHVSFPGGLLEVEIGQGGRPLLRGGFEIVFTGKWNLTK